MDASNSECLQRFIRLCNGAWKRGWHEANGGNLSYRLSREELDAFSDEAGPSGKWQLLPTAFPELAREGFLISASGAYLSNAAIDPEKNLGVIEISDDGSAYRVRWGLEGSHPSSELLTHLSVFRSSANDGEDDVVVYHAHPPNVLALSAVKAADSKEWTNVLWRSMTESVIMFPQGLAVIDWMVPGSPELAEKTRELMKRHRACVWAHHGIMVRGRSFDEAFGVVDTVEKAAGVYLTARSACGGGEPEHFVSTEQLREICSRYDIEPNEEYLS